MVGYNKYTQEIELDCMNRTELVQVNDRYLALVNAVMNIPVP
jgi:hypothetical protein